MDQVLRLLGVQREEAEKAFLMMGYLFFLIFGAVMAKAVRDGLFLSRYSAMTLPYLYISIALLAGLTGGLYARISRNVQRRTAILGTHWIIGLTILLLWWLLVQYRWGWLLFVFYLWVTVYPAITTSQFWLVANELFDARRAKRLFGLIGSGGILGGICGGFAARWIAPRFGAEQLLWAVSLTSLGCIALMTRIRHGPTPTLDTKGKSSVQERLRDLRNSRYLVWIALLVGLTELISTLIDFQFKVVAQQAFPVKNQLTAFFGALYGYLNLANLFLQIFLAGRIMSRLGLRSAMLLLPLIILGGSVALFLTVSLWSVILLKFGDDGVRHSLNRSAVETLYLPLPAGIKEKSKIFIDSFVVRIATGLGGILVLLYAQLFAAGIHKLSLLVLVLTLAWIILCFLVYSEYVNAFRDALKKRSIDPESVILEIKDVSALETLIQALNSSDERVVLYAMQFLERTGKSYLINPWLLHHPSPKVRLKVVQLLSGQGRSALSMLKNALKDESVEVQAEAVQTICVIAPENHSEMVYALSREKDPKLRRAAILCAAQGSREEQELARQWLLQMVQPRGAEASIMHIEAAKALGKLPSEYHDILQSLLQSEHLPVLKEAVRSAALTGNQSLVPLLLEKLGHRKLKSEAREALLKYGPDLIPFLDDCLLDRKIDLWVRRHIPRTIGAFGTQHAVNSLLKHHKHSDRFIRFKILKALNKLRITSAELAFNRDILERWLMEEATHYAQYLALKHSLFSSEPGTEQASRVPHMLEKSMEQKLDRSFDRLFRLLALIYSPRDIFNAYSSLKSENPATRSAALEFLDGLLERSIRRIILPLVDQIPEKERLKQTEAIFEAAVLSRAEALSRLLQDQDSWLVACTVHWIYSQQFSEHYSKLPAFLQHEEPLIRETTQAVMERLKSHRRV